MEKRNKIRDWENKRDDLNEKLDSCQDKLRLVKQDEKPRDAKADEDLLAAAKVRNEYLTHYFHKSNWKRGGVAVSALNFRSEGRWFKAWSQPSCCFLRQEIKLHIV